MTSASRRTLGLAACLTASWGAAPLGAQEPDSVAAPDSLAVADSLGAPGPEAQEPDSLATDSVEVRYFPLFPDPASSAPGAVITWELPDILAHGGLSFADLVEFTPYLDPVRVGFLEGPQATVFAGSGPIGLRYNADGYEIAPLVGGPLDLHQIPLVEVERLRLIREPGGYRTASQGYRNRRGEPYSRIEAGTGLRQTNLLRAILSSRVGGAVVGLGFDRIDTNGSPELGSFARNFVWLNLAYQLPGQVWGQLEWRNTSSDRESLPTPKRRDWILRLRRTFGDAWYADIIAGSGR
ncbi:MAG: hypothetical protein JSU87_09700, partial [Gemmatimonadota bacterium]